MTCKKRTNSHKAFVQYCFQMSIVQDLNRCKLEFDDAAPVGPVQLLGFDNISIILQWSSVWGMLPGMGGQKSPEEVCCQKAAGGASQRVERAAGK